MTPQTQTDDDEPTRRTLARIGVLLGDNSENPRLWRIALRAMPSAPGDVGSDQWTAFVAAQVYGDAPVGTQPQTALDFIDCFLSVYGIEDLSDVDGLLGRERHERSNYAGHISFIESKDNIEADTATGDLFRGEYGGE